MSGAFDRAWERDQANLDECERPSTRYSHGGYLDGTLVPPPFDSAAKLATGQEVVDVDPEAIAELRKALGA